MQLLLKSRHMNIESEHFTRMWVALRKFLCALNAALPRRSFHRTIVSMMVIKVSASKKRQPEKNSHDFKVLLVDSLQAKDYSPQNQYGSNSLIGDKQAGDDRKIRLTVALCAFHGKGTTE